MGKKPYVKPMVAFINQETGEISGSPEIVARLKGKISQGQLHIPIQTCELEDFTCSVRSRQDNG